jgi:hypothetical protein
MPFRITKGDITIEASTEDELATAVKVLTDHNVPIPSLFGQQPPGPKYLAHLLASLPVIPVVPPSSTDDPIGEGEFTHE